MASAATLNATTLEGQLFEVVEQISRHQGDVARNPNGVTVVSAYSRNNNTGVISVTLSIPSTDTIDATTGGNLVQAEEVYVD